MKKKHLLLTLGCATLIGASLMTGCGEKKTETPSTETTSSEVSESVETTPSEEPTTEETLPEVEEETEEVAGDEINIEDYVTESYEDGKLIIKAKTGEFVWEQFNDGFIDVAETQDGEFTVYTVTGTEASPTSISLIGDYENTRISYLVMLEVKEDKTIDANYTVESTTMDMSDMGMEDMPMVEEDLDTLINDTLAALGEENMPGMLATRPVNLEDKDDTAFVLGVESLDGLNSAAVSEPMMTSVAFQLVALRFDDNASAEAAAKQLIETAPTTKWICVEPEEVKTKVVNDTYVLFFMGTKDAATNFEK